MRAILALAVIVLLMGLAGWLTIGRSPERTTINIETDEIQRDTQEAVDDAERMIDFGARAIKGGVHSQPEPARPASIVLDEEPVALPSGQTPAPSPVVTP